MALPDYLPVGSKQIGSLLAQTITSNVSQSSVGFVGWSTDSGLTATAGGTKAAALPLVKSLNFLSVCATANDSVILPAYAAGRVIFIYNDGAAAAKVYGAGTDTIDAVATATGVVLTNAKWSFYIGSETAGNWISVGGAGHSV